MGHGHIWVYVAQLLCGDDTHRWFLRTVCEGEADSPKKKVSNMLNLYINLSLYSILQN